MSRGLPAVCAVLLLTSCGADQAAPPEETSGAGSVSIATIVSEQGSETSVVDVSDTSDRATPVDDEADPSTPALESPPPPSTTVETSTTTSLPELPEYVFPFVGRNVSYPRGHHSYPAVDVFGCGATILAPTRGVIGQTRIDDFWDPATNNPAHRGGRYVTLHGDDGVRYYFAHLESVAVNVGQEVLAGDVLGIMGATGNARSSVCHVHFGMSRLCAETEWQVRRGEIWPQPYLDDWRNGGSASPTLEIYATILEDPEACERAYAAPHAAEA